MNVEKYSGGIPENSGEEMPRWQRFLERYKAYVDTIAPGAQLGLQGAEEAAESIGDLMRACDPLIGMGIDYELASGYAELRGTGSEKVVAERMAAHLELTEIPEEVRQIFLELYGDVLPVTRPDTGM